MPIHFTLTGSDGSARPLTVPIGWAELTLGQLLRLRTEPDTPRLCTEPDTPRLCILTDLTANELARIDPPDLLYFDNSLEFLGDQMALIQLLTFLLSPNRG